MPTTRVRVVSVISVLVFLCFHGFHVVVTTRTQHTKTLAHIEKVSTGATFNRANFYRATFRCKGSAGAIGSYILKLQIIKTGYLQKQNFFLELNITGTSLCFVALRLKLNAMLYQFLVFALQFVAKVAHTHHFAKRLLCRIFVLMLFLAIQLAYHVVVFVHKLMHALRQLPVLRLQVGDDAGQCLHAIVVFCFHCCFVLWVCYIFIHTHTLYAVWCCQVRREGRQSCRAVRLSRYWLSVCVVRSLRDPCRPCRCVPSRCNTCQSYSINIAGALHCDVVLLAMFAHPSLA